jgi:hypothetical protein
MTKTLRNTRGQFTTLAKLSIDIKNCLIKNKCNRNATSAELGINRKTLYKYIEESSELQVIIEANEVWEAALYKRTKTERTWSVRNNGFKSKAYRLVGTYYEQIFNVEAMKSGLYPHIPVGDILPWDVVVYSNENRGYRVQIKGTNTPKQGGSYRIRTTTDTPKNYDPDYHRRYIPLNAEHCDIVACYLEQLDIWYLIPVKDCSSASMTFFPTNPNSCGKYEKYLNDWTIFK